MADVSVKMGVSGVSQFKSQMTQAQASVKKIDAALKLNEQQYKATGDAETYMQNKTNQLNSKLKAQQDAVKSAQSALQQMKDSGVDPLSVSYQKMETALLNAQSAVLDTQAQIGELGAESVTASGQIGQMADTLSGLNKTISLDNVIKGIDNITTGMENAAKKAIELGKSIWDNIVDSASYADDVATLASRLGLSTTEVQQMQFVANQFEAPVEDIGKAWQRTKKSIASDSQDVEAIYRELGVATHDVVSQAGKYAPVEMKTARDYRDVFWETGEALMKMTDETKREEYAQKLLGKSWDEFIPLFTAGREAYETAVGAAPAATDEAVQNAAELNDKLKELESSFNTLKLQIIGDIAPALSKAAEALTGVINSITDYLQTDAGQEQLQRMSDALSGLLSDITKIDPEAVVETFASVFSGIVDSFEWISDHWEEVKAALIGIGVGFAAIKLTTVGLSIANVISGFKGLGAASAAGAGAAGAAGAGSVLGGMAVVALGAILCAPALAQIIKGELPEAKDAAQIFDNITSKMNGREGNENATTNTVGSILSGDTDAGQIVEDTLKTVGDSLAGRANGNEAVNKGIRSFITGDNSEWGISEDEKWYYQPSELNPNVTNQIANAVNLVLKNLEEGRAFNEGLTDKHDYRYSTDYVDMMGELIRQLGQDTAIRVLQNPESWSLMRESYNDLGRINSKTYAQWFVNEVLRRGMDYDPEAEAREAQRKAEEAQAIIQQADEAKKRNTKPSWFPSNWDEMDMMEQFGKKSEWFSSITPDMLNEIMDETIRAKLQQGIDENNVALFEEALTEIANLGKESSDESKALENATTAMESMPENVADAVSKTKINLMLSDGLLGMLGNSHANGLPYVPFDGYMALLHRGERVMTARENRNYTTNSNIYFGNVNLNNGLEIEQLTESIDRHNRRKASGYGG